MMPAQAAENLVSAIIAPIFTDTAANAPDADPPLLCAQGVSHYYGERVGCRDISIDLWPGEVLAIVGESGSGKSTLLNLLAGRFPPARGSIRYRDSEGALHDINSLPEAMRRRLLRTEWGFVHQNPRDGLRMRVSAGGNIGERLMACGNRHYGNIRGAALNWLSRVEIAADRIDDRPADYSGGMQQRLQIARNLVSSPRLVFMDEPTGGLDVSVQAKLLDLLRQLVQQLNLSVVLVTHDLAVARLLAHRMIVMRQGEVVETGLSDQVLDDPQHAYTQLLVSSILQG
jgi:putative phosphonate transport system ATP-binding protein